MWYVSSEIIMKAHFSADDLSSLLVSQVSIYTRLFLCERVSWGAWRTAVLPDTEFSVFKHLAVARKQSQRLDVQ